VTPTHPPPSSGPDRSTVARRRCEPVPTPAAGSRVAAPSAPMALRELLRRYRAGTSVIALAKEFGVSFEWVARRVIASGTRRDQTSLRRIRDRPAELDSDDWLSDQLAGGAGVGDLSRRLHVTRSTVRNALRHYAARRANGDAVCRCWPFRPRRALRGGDRAGRAGDRRARAGTTDAGLCGHGIAPVRTHDHCRRRPTLHRRAPRGDLRCRRPTPRSDNG
jgi:hypothetical protein